MNRRLGRLVCVAGTVIIGVPCAVVVELLGVIMKAAAWTILGAIVGLPLWILIGSLASGKVGWVKPQTDVEQLTQRYLGHQ